MLDTSNSWNAVKDAAFANLSAWVPSLNLPKTKSYGDSYRAVASFRPSRAGVSDEKRPRALTISPRGICDHADGDRGYSPIDLVCEVLGLSPADAKDWLSNALGGVDVPAYVPITQSTIRLQPSTSERTPAKLAAIGRLWDSCMPIAGTPADAYLSGRGLSYDGDAIRFRPVGCTMAVAITDAVTGELIGVQQTHLRRNGEAIRRQDGKKLKLTTGFAGGGVVRLSSDEDVTLGLAIGEGVETCLAAPFRPIWACLVANNLERFPVLSGIESLTIFADNDASGTGIRAAKECAERWHSADREVTVRMIDAVGVDYADIVKEAA